MDNSASADDPKGRKVSIHALDPHSRHLLLTHIYYIALQQYQGDLQGLR